MTITLSPLRLPCSIFLPEFAASRRAERRAPGHPAYIPA
jgi:hypothetical protein